MQDSTIRTIIIIIVILLLSTFAKVAWFLPKPAKPPPVIQLPPKQNHAPFEPTFRQRRFLECLRNGPRWKMSINVKDVDKLIKNVLLEIGYYSDNAYQLLRLTCAQESHYGTYLYQIGGGPARGLFQMEPRTEMWLWNKFPDLLEEYDSSSRQDLIGNIPYQIVAARCYYLVWREPLPEASDHVGLAKYWKKYWNSIKGKGTVEEAVVNYRKFCL